MGNPTPTYTAFAGHSRIAAGELPVVASMVRRRLDAGEPHAIAIFEDETCRPVDLDLRGTPEEVAARAQRQIAATQQAEDTPAGRGRPRLGVVAREVTLLPRHWDWLNAQPGGASVTLRKLVEVARKQGHASEQVRRTQDRAYRFLSAMGGDLPGFEEAVRALYAWDLPRLKQQLAAWPDDVRAHALSLVRAEGQPEIG